MGGHVWSYNITNAIRYIPGLGRHRLNAQAGVFVTMADEGLAGIRRAVR